MAEEVGAPADLLACRIEAFDDLVIRIPVLASLPRFPNELTCIRDSTIFLLDPLALAAPPVIAEFCTMRARVYCNQSICHIPFVSLGSVVREIPIQIVEQSCRCAGGDVHLIIIRPSVAAGISRDDRNGI